MIYTLSIPQPLAAIVAFGYSSIWVKPQRNGKLENEHPAYTGPVVVCSTAQELQPKRISTALKTFLRTHFAEPELGRLWHDRAEFAPGVALATVRIMEHVPMFPPFMDEAVFQEWPEDDKGEVAVLHDYRLLDDVIPLASPHAEPGIYAYGGGPLMHDTPRYEPGVLQLAWERASLPSGIAPTARPSVLG